MLRLRCTTDCQPLMKNGKPHHRTTGVASASSIQFHTVAANMCCRGMAGRNEETISASIGAANATLIHRRLVMSFSSGFDSSAVTSRGSSAMPHIGQLPGPGRTICGCIGHVYSVCLAGAVTVTGSSAMPHFGQLPGPVCLISGCMGQVYSACGAVVVGALEEAVSGLVCAYFPGAERNLAAQAWLQK